jgi:hypothetical protein
MNTEEKVEFSTKELQDKYDAAKLMSNAHLKKLDMIGVDIKRAEAFLQKSGYGEYKKYYGDIALIFDGKRLCYLHIPLIDMHVRGKLEAHPFLGDFLESIATHYSLIGVPYEDN